MVTRIICVDKGRELSFDLCHGLARYGGAIDHTGCTTVGNFQIYLRILHK